MSLRKHGFLGDEAKAIVALIREEHKELFILIDEANNLANDVTSEIKIDLDDLQQLLAGSLLSRAMHGFYSTIILVQQGLESDSKVVLRSLLDTVFILGSVCNNKEFTAEYIKSEKARQLKMANVIINDQEGSFDKSKFADLEKRRDSLKEEVSFDNIKSHSSEELSKIAGLYPIYQTAYRILSDDVHISPRSLECFFKLDEKKKLQCLDLGPKTDSLMENLCTAVSIILHAIDCICILMKIDVPKDSDNLRRKLVAISSKK
jgi:hypothetical protein